MLRAPRKLHLRRAGAPLGVCAALILGSLAACALPQDRLTGLEVSWSMLEREASGEELRLRTCAGALVRRVELTLEDLSDPARSSAFAYTCELGYQTEEELESRTSNIFVDLRPGEYRLLALAISDVDGGSFELEESFAVGERDLLKLDLDLGPPSVPWTLDIAGAESCSVAAGSLAYAEPTEDLVRLDGEVATTARYRDGLVGDGGLALDGAEVACDGPWAQSQGFTLDPGRYILNLQVDGRTCAIPIVIPFSGQRTTLDLAKLPCDG